MNIFGSSILVTGAGGGIGGAIARELASRGANLILVNRDPARLAEFAATLRKDGAQVTALAGDLALPGEPARLIAAALAHAGTIDILINCAGSLSVAPSLVVDKEALQATVDSNLVGAFTIAQAAGRAMKAAGGGRIIQVSSVRAYAGTKTGFAAYGAAKAGVNQLVRQLATEWAEHNILVNGIAPGFVETPFVDAPTHNAEFVERVRRRIPMGRLGKPEEIAGAVLFLCSPLSTFVTGQIIVIDGGVTASQ